MPLQIRQTLLARGPIRREKASSNMLRLGLTVHFRQREIEQAGAPRPEVGSARCHHLHVTFPNPNQQGPLTTLSKRFPAIVQPFQQVIQPIRPRLQAHKLCRTLVSGIAEPLEQIFGANSDVTINSNAKLSPQQVHEKTDRRFAIGAIGIGQEAKDKRLPTFHQPAKPKQRAGVFRVERPRGTDFTHQIRRENPERPCTPVWHESRDGCARSSRCTRAERDYRANIECAPNRP